MKKSKHQKSKQKPVIHDQWIEIRKVDNAFVTTFYPPNEEFERLRLEMDPPATLIYRRFNFVHGVPLDYMWTRPPYSVQQIGGLFLQRIQVQDWPRVLESDRRANHLTASPGPCFVPRPECFGPCPCEECVAEESNDHE